MPRRAMLPYPSTSRRLCTAARCPKVTTIALVSILFACLYNSRTFLSKDQPALNRVVDTAVPQTVLEPAVGVVKEVVHKSDTAILSFAQRDTSDGTHTVYSNEAAPTVQEQSLSVAELPTDVKPVSVAEVDTDDREKDLVGLIADAQKDQAEHIVSVDGTPNSESGTVTSETVALDAATAEAVDRTENPLSVTAAETIPAVEKADEETVIDAATTTLEGASTTTVLDSAERTDESESSAVTGVVDGEVPETQKEVVDETSAATDTVTSQSDPVGVDAEVFTAEKQESADETQTAGEDIQGVDSEVVIADKQESADENATVESVVDVEVATTLVSPMEKDVSESSETEEVQTTDKQEAEQAVLVEGAPDATERAEVDSASVTEPAIVEGQEAVEDGLDTAEKQDTVISAETDSAELISDSEKQTESADEAVNSTEIAAAEKQEEVKVDASMPNESEKETVETADSTEVADLSVTDKIADEQGIEKVSEVVNTAVQGGDEMEAEDKQAEISESEAVKEEDETIAETALEDALGTAERLDDDETPSSQEAQADYDLSHEEKQAIDVKVDEGAGEKADDEATEALQDGRR